MVVKDFMIGDWLSVYDASKKVVGLHSLGGNTIYLLGEYSSNQEIYSDNIVALDNYALPLSDVKPIPLTDEIIKLNDFEYDEDYKTHYHKKEDCIISISPKKKRTEFTWCVEIGKHSFYFNYVHELQHILIVCGLVELADNFKIE